MLGIDIVLLIFYQDYDVLLVSYVDNGLGVWIYGDVVENKYVFFNVYFYFFILLYIYDVCLFVLKGFVFDFMVIRCISFGVRLYEILCGSVFLDLIWL